MRLENKVLKLSLTKFKSAPKLDSKSKKSGIRRELNYSKILKE